MVYVNHLAIAMLPPRGNHPAAGCGDNRSAPRGVDVLACMKFKGAATEGVASAAKSAFQPSVNGSERGSHAALSQGLLVFSHLLLKVRGLVIQRCETGSRW